MEQPSSLTSYLLAGLRLVSSWASDMIKTFNNSAGVERLSRGKSAANGPQTAAHCENPKHARKGLLSAYSCSGTVRVDPPAF